LINFTYAAAQGDVRRFNPAPIGVEVKYLDDEKKERVSGFTDGTDKKKLNPQALVRSVFRNLLTLRSDESLKHLTNCGRNGQICGHGLLMEIPERFQSLGLSPPSLDYHQQSSSLGQTQQSRSKRHVNPLLTRL
jgi:hypothetical protein